jgi:hypothetical protein
MIAKHAHEPPAPDWLVDLGWYWRTVGDAPRVHLLPPVIRERMATACGKWIRGRVRQATPGARVCQACVARNGAGP